MDEEPEADAVAPNMPTDAEFGLLGKLNDCYELLQEIAFHHKPIVGGFRKKAKDLLDAHGVIETEIIPEEM